MAHAEKQIVIDKPVADVFNFILDGENNPKWRPACTDIQRLTPKPDGIGAKFKQGLKGPGGRIDGDYEITECEPNRSIVFKVIAGPARPTGRYVFTSSGNSTMVTFSLDFTPSGLQKLMGGMIQKQMESEVANLTNLKTVLESRDLSRQF